MQSNDIIGLDNTRHYCSHFQVLSSQFVFMFGSGFGVRRSAFGIRYRARSKALNRKSEH